MRRAGDTNFPLPPFLSPSSGQISSPLPLEQLQFPTLEKFGSSGETVARVCVCSLRVFEESKGDLFFRRRLTADSQSGTLQKREARYVFPPLCDRRRPREMEIPEGQLGAAKGKRDLFSPSAVAARECTVGRGFYPLEEGKRSGNPFVACCSFGRNGEGREKNQFWAPLGGDGVTMGCCPSHPNLLIATWVFSLGPLRPKGRHGHFPLSPLRWN